MQAVSSNEHLVCAWIQQILEYVSRFMTLFPGDVILTGRPPPLDGFPPYGVPVEASS
jgi:2-keto-4-pentenoate hydratase/2-oxohepta-3-ene-1,7-dioic acid hydratase in catechol pathway